MQFWGPSNDGLLGTALGAYLAVLLILNAAAEKASRSRIRRLWPGGVSA